MFRPRRLVSAFPMNHEFELAEARLRMQAHLVDAFILQESAYSNAGQPRPLLVWERLQRGWLAELHPQIIYVLRDQPPPAGFQ